jgi:hypothetical protein
MMGLPTEREMWLVNGLRDAFLSVIETHEREAHPGETCTEFGESVIALLSHAAGIKVRDDDAWERILQGIMHYEANH